MQSQKPAYDECLANSVHNNQCNILPFVLLTCEIRISTFSLLLNALRIVHMQGKICRENPCIFARHEESMDKMHLERRPSKDTSKVIMLDSAA